MAYVELYKQCRRCMGTGVANETAGDPPVVEDPCMGCDGTGKVLLGYVSFDDIIDKCNDILDKCNDILEAIN